MKRILVIDDERNVRTIVTRMLTDKGYEVVAAANGAEALKLCARETPVMVITDIIMPEKEGIETIRALRRTDPALPILAISGGGRIRDTELLHLAERIGATDTLAKPFTQQELLTKVQACLGPSAA